MFYVYKEKDGVSIFSSKKSENNLIGVTKTFLEGLELLKEKEVPVKWILIL